MRWLINRPGINHKRNCMNLKYYFTPIDTSIFNYPKWKQMIPENPTHEEFEKAWIDNFEFPFNECRIRYGETTFAGNSLGTGLTIHTPNGVIFHGGFGCYTDEPVLSEEDIFFYQGGCDWGIDMIGQKYYRIDAETMMPKNWAENRNNEIITRHLIRNGDLIIK